MNLLKKISSQLKSLNFIKELSDKGEIYLVGGIVRDAILNVESKDIDLLVDKLSIDEIKTILTKHGTVVEVGESFGVLKYKDKNFDTDFDIAIPRTEVSTGEGYRDFEVNTEASIKDDIFRRDLTINALFYDIDKEQVVDLVGGVKDLEDGIIRTVGDADERFTEDRLRVLRAIRFSSRLGFEIHDDVYVSIIRNNNLSKVSKERVRDEFLKCVKTAKSLKKLRSLLSFYKLDDQIFPDLKLLGFSTDTNNVDVLLALALRTNPVSTLKKALNKLTYTNDEVTRICFMIESLELDESNVFAMKKSFLRSKVEKSELELFHSLSEEDSGLVKVFNEFELSVTGESLLEEGFKPGPEMGIEIKKRELNKFKTLLKEKEA